jgi:spore coat polysaccharide biosynthesis predicted glycosyltransferase SpsG
LLVIDDTAHLNKYHADIILNQNINAEQLRYPVDRRTRLLLGLRYLLLRPEFAKQPVWVSESPENARRLLVTLGGADFDNQTMRVINAIEEINIDGLEAKIVVGPANRHLKELQTRVKRSKIPIQLKVNTSRMAVLMSWADLAITAGGSTCWELACIGLPALVIILTENQMAVAKGLHEKGAVTNLGWYHDLSTDQIAQAVEHLLLNAAKRKKMAAVSRKLVDGRGTARVLRNLIEQ